MVPFQKRARVPSCRPVHILTMRQRYRQHRALFLSIKCIRAATIYWQPTISNSDVTFRSQSAALSFSFSLRQPGKPTTWPRAATLGLDSFLQNHTAAMGCTVARLYARSQRSFAHLAHRLTLAERRLAGETAARASFRPRLVPLHGGILMLL